MTKTFVGVITLVVLTAGLHPMAASGVAGRWNLSAASPHGELSMALLLKQEGKRVTGTLGNPHGGADIPLEGEFADGTLTFSTNADAGADVPAMDFNGKLNDDGTLTGYLSTSRGDMKCTATRVKE
jgi:hypothetical protein